MPLPGLNHGLELCQSFHFSNAGALAEQRRRPQRKCGFRSRVDSYTHLDTIAGGGWRCQDGMTAVDGRIWYGARMALGNEREVCPRSGFLGCSQMHTKLDAGVKREEMTEGGTLEHPLQPRASDLQDLEKNAGKRRTRENLDREL
jgi:hypothetical protein